MLLEDVQVYCVYEKEDASIYFLLYFFTLLFFRLSLLYNDTEICSIDISVTA